MRPFLLVGSLVLASVLGGCVSPDGYPQWDPQANTTFGAGGNQTVPPANATVVEAAPAPDAPPAAPPSVPTVPYAASDPIELARLEGDGATLSLVAGPDGLSCVSTPTWDPDAAPRGHRLVETWASCSLSVDNASFAGAQAAQWDVGLPVLDAIPVDNFTWQMEVGRVIENNTGARDQVVVEADETVWAAPTVSSHSDPSWPQACATFLGWSSYGRETLLLAARAQNGRAVLETDLEGFDVVDWHSAQNATEANGTFTVLGDWGRESLAELEVTIDFRARDPHYLAFGGTECPTATSVEDQTVPFSATAEGVAAGWRDGAESAVVVEVYSNGF